MSAIVNARDVLLQAAAIRFVTPVLTGTIPLGQVTGAGDLAAQDTVGAGQLDAGIITATAFASGIEPVTLVAGVPGTPYTSTIFNTVDGKLYRWNGSAYVATVPTTDLAGTVADAQIAGLAAAKITGQLTNAQIADVAAAKISGQLTNAQIADIAATKVTGQLTNAQIADVAAAKLTGSITTTQITDSAIITAKLAAGSVVTAKIAAGAVTAGEIAADAVTSAKIIAGAITTAKIAAGAVTAGEIAAFAVTTAKLDAAAVTTAKIAAGAVTADEIAANAVTAAKIVAGAVTTAKLAAGAVTANEIAAGAVTAGKVAALAITSAELAADSVIAGKVAAGAISTTQLAAGAVTTAKLAAGAVTANEIAAGAVTAGKVAAGAISTTQLAAGAVTTAKLAAGSVTANEISVTSLSAIAANMGAITAGTITFSGAGNIKSGKTDYGAGTGFFLGHSGSTPVLDIGSTSNYLRWSGSSIDALVNGAARFTGAWTGAKGTTVLEAATSSGTNVSALVGISSGVGGAGVRGDGYTYGVRGEGGTYGTHGSSAYTGAYGSGEVYGVHGYGTTIGSVGVRAESAGGPALQVAGTMTMSSSTLVANLNAQYLNGNASSAFAVASHASGVNTDHDARYPNNWPTDSGTAYASNGMNITCTITGYRTRGSSNTIYIEPVSDERLKYEIEPEPLGRDFMRRLRTVRYRKTQGGVWHHGFLHRHMARLLPASDDALATVLPDGAGSVDYQSLVAPIVKAFQEQDADLVALAAQVKQLATDLQTIRSQ